jgi:hypothetical protein
MFQWEPSASSCAINEKFSAKSTMQMTLFHDTSITAKKSGFIDCIIWEMPEVQHHCNINQEEGSL